MNTISKFIFIILSNIIVLFILNKYFNDNYILVILGISTLIYSGLMFHIIYMIYNIRKNININIDICYSILNDENEYSFFNNKERLERYILLCTNTINSTNKYDYPKETKRLNDLQTEILLKEIILC